jgi:site-specific DNA-cytosine methylase
VNDEMLRLYWDLGHDIVVRQMDAVWGSGFYKNLSKELRAEFPNMQGFSVTNLNYCKRFYQFYASDTQLCQQIGNVIHPQVEGGIKINPLFSIPWGHHKNIIDTGKL